MHRVCTMHVHVYTFPSCPLSYPSASNPVNLGVANSPPTLLQLGGGVVLEYSNGDICKGQQKMKTTLILNCDKDTPIVSILLYLYMYMCDGCNRERDKATQHYSPKALIFQREIKLPWVGFKLTSALQFIWLC